MSKVVYKYPVTFGPQIIEMPKDAEILTVQLQRGEPQLWALVDPKLPVKHRLITIVGTGQSVQGNVRYIGTFQLEYGNFVFHAFENDPR